MRNLALAVIVIQSIALILLSIFAKIQYSKAEVNAMAAYKQQQFLVQEKEVNDRLTEELLECRKLTADSTSANGVVR